MSTQIVTDYTDQNVATFDRWIREASGGHLKLVRSTDGTGWHSIRYVDDRPLPDQTPRVTDEDHTVSGMAFRYHFTPNRKIDRRNKHERRDAVKAVRDFVDVVVRTLGNDYSTVVDIDIAADRYEP